MLWHSLSRGSVAPPPSPEGLFPSMEGIRGVQLCAEGPMCRRPKLRLKGQICFADWSSSLEQVLGKLLNLPASTPTVIQNREPPQPRHHLNPSDESYLSTLIPCPHYRPPVGSTALACGNLLRDPPLLLNSPARKPNVQYIDARVCLLALTDGPTSVRRCCASVPSVRAANVLQDGALFNV